MKLKHNPSWNHKEEEFLNRGIHALRSEPVDSSGVPGAVARMMMTVRHPIGTTIALRYLSLGAAAVGFAVFSLWPRSSHAASIREIVMMAKQQSTRYERVLKPDAHGRLTMYLEQWGAPGKYANRFVNEGETRFNGRLEYSFRHETNTQVIEESNGSDALEIDPVGLEAFDDFKLLRVDTEGSRLRYVFQMAPSRQEIVVDAATKLPIERDVIKSDGSIMEVHQYFFQKTLDPNIFEPDIKPGVRTINLPEDRKKLDEMLLDPPQCKMVAGVRVNLHAVIVDDVSSIVAAVVSGGDARPPVRNPLVKSPLAIVGLPDGFATPEAAYSSLAGQAPDVTNTLQVNGEPARVDQTSYQPKVSIPDEFVLRVPVWKRDPSLPLLDWQSHKRIGDDSCLVGWAEFKVNHPLRTYGIARVLPNYVFPKGVCPAPSVATTQPTVPSR